jgi:hypothetical protein
MYLRQQPGVGEDAVLGRANLAREKPVDLPVGRFVGRDVQPCLQKYFASPVGQIISTNSRHPTPPEGRWPSSRTRGGMRWTRQRFARDGIAGRVERLLSDHRRADERCCCVRQNRVVLTPRRWRQVLRSCVGPTGLRQNISADDGGKRARSPGSNCIFEVDLRSAGLKAGAARHRLRRLPALTPAAHRSVGLAGARPNAERGRGALVNPPRSDWHPISRRGRS